VVVSGASRRRGYHQLVTCCHPDYDAFYDDRMARRELEAYRRHGASGDTRRLIDALRAEGVGGMAVLDIGGGVGAIGHELLADGATRVTNVDASRAYLAAARSEVERRGWGDRADFHHGDFVELAGDIGSADIVTLDKVVCCYRDWPALIGASVERAGRLYGLVYPVDRWWTRLAWPLLNAMLALMRQSVRSYVHPEREIDERIRSGGFERGWLHRGPIWQTVIYRRLAA
jgi:magnesium-protoporphyrin O-methyltransferase